MSRTFVRRAATAVASFGVAAGSLLVAGGTASAAPEEPLNHRPAVVTHDIGSHRQDDGCRDRDGRRWDGIRWADRRWDGGRWWERSGHAWYSQDHHHRYRYDGHHFYRWHQNTWVIWNTGGGFDIRLFD
jgi:hypothetical protein